MSDDNCLDAASPEGPVKLVRCHGMGGNQAWVFNDDVSKTNTKVYFIPKCLNFKIDIKVSQKHNKKEQKIIVTFYLTYPKIAKILGKKMVRISENRQHKIGPCFQDKTLRHMNTNRCLATQPSDPNVPKLVECNPNSSYQQWIMSSKFKWQAS
jgi:hypothetical protein